MFRTTNVNSSVNTSLFYVTIPTLLYPDLGPAKLTQKRHSTFFFSSVFSLVFLSLVWNLMIQLGAYNKPQLIMNLFVYNLH